MGIAGRKVEEEEEPVVASSNGCRTLGRAALPPSTPTISDTAPRLYGLLAADTAAVAGRANAVLFVLLFTLLMRNVIVMHEDEAIRV